MRVSDDLRVTPVAGPKAPSRNPRFDAAVEAERRRADRDDEERAPRGRSSDREKRPAGDEASGPMLPTPAPQKGASDAVPPRSAAFAAGTPSEQPTLPPAPAAPLAAPRGTQLAMQALDAPLRSAGAFTLTFPPNAWPLLRAEGLRGAKGLSLRLVADTRDADRLRGAVSALRAELEAAGERVLSLTVETGREG